MNDSKRFQSRRRPRTSPNRRTELLAAFDRSGLSAATFAREQGIRYTTFCGWRHRQAKRAPAPDFVAVEVAVPPPNLELLVELGGAARLRITSPAQLDLAARLVQQFNALAAC